MLLPSEAKEIGDEVHNRTISGVKTWPSFLGLNALLVMLTEVVLNERGYYIIHANDVLPQNLNATVGKIKHAEQMREVRQKNALDKYMDEHRPKV